MPAGDAAESGGHGSTAAQQIAGDKTGDAAVDARIESVKAQALADQAQAIKTSQETTARIERERDEEIGKLKTDLDAAKTEPDKAAVKAAIGASRSASGVALAQENGRLQQRLGEIRTNARTTLARLREGVKQAQAADAIKAAQAADAAAQAAAGAAEEAAKKAADAAAAAAQQKADAARGGAPPAAPTR